jgi:5-methylcytosine-specific restriction protein A
MPQLPPHPCPYPGCRALVRRGRCEQHTLPRAPDTRPARQARGYTRTWEKLRAIVLQEEPLCQICKAQGITEVATEVDHIVPLSKGGTNERSNLQSLSKSCHSKKTAREDGGGWKA